jgi:hypothetical protein
MIGRGVKHMAKRGRPFKGDFAWMDQIPDEELPEHIRKRRQQGLDSPENQELIDIIRAQISDYHKGLSEWNQIPEEIFLAYAGLNQGFGFSTPEDEATIKAAYEVAYAKAKGNAYQVRGTKAGKKNKLTRAEKVWLKPENKSLLQKVQAGNLKLESACKSILSEWATRGDGTYKVPSEPPKGTQTLRHWYEAVFPEKK